MQASILANLYCPFPARQNQYVEDIEFYGLQWVMQFNLLDSKAAYRQFCAAKFHLLTAKTYTNSPLESLCLINDWISWIFFFDDKWDTLHKHASLSEFEVERDRVMQILRGASVAEHEVPLYQALQDLYQRSKQHLSPNGLRRFVWTVDQYLEGASWELSNSVHEQIPDVEAFIKGRYLISFVEPLIELFDASDRIQLPNEILEHQHIRSLKQATVNIVGWCNDIYSLPKDIKDGVTHNLVLVIQNQYHLTLDAAIQHVLAMHNTEVERFLNLSRTIPSFGNELDTEIQRWVSGLIDWIRGHQDWGIELSGRYGINSPTLVTT